MRRDPQKPGDAPEPLATDFLTSGIAVALMQPLEAIIAQGEAIREAEGRREEAYKILQRGSRRKRNQRASGVHRDSDGWRPIFLAALRTAPNVRLATDAAQIASRTAYEHRNKDPQFREAWDDALRDGVGLLHAAAIHRATVGTLDPIYQGGVLVGYRRQYSDNLLALLLKGHMSDMFRENHAVAVKAEVKVEEVKREQENMTPARVREITNAMLPKLMAIMNPRNNAA